MKRIVLAAAATVMLATMAGASSITFSIPNLTFPPSPDVTVTKDCVTPEATSGVCLTQE